MLVLYRTLCVTWMNVVLPLVCSTLRFELGS